MRGYLIFLQRIEAFRSVYLKGVIENITFSFLACIYFIYIASRLNVSDI